MRPFTPTYPTTFKNFKCIPSDDAKFTLSTKLPLKFQTKMGMKAAFLENKAFFSIRAANLKKKTALIRT